MWTKRKLVFRRIAIARPFWKITKNFLHKQCRADLFLYFDLFQIWKILKTVSFFAVFLRTGREIPQSPQMGWMWNALILLGWMWNSSYFCWDQEKELFWIIFTLFLDNSYRKKMQLVEFYKRRGFLQFDYFSLPFFLTKIF